MGWLRTRGLVARCQLDGRCVEVEVIFGSRAAQVSLAPGFPRSASPQSRLSRLTPLTGRRNAAGHHASAIGIPLVPKAVSVTDTIRSRQYRSRRLSVYPIATKRQLSTTPTAANSSQLVLFFMPATPYRFLTVGPG